MRDLIHKNKNFFYYLTGNIISSCGDYIDDIALAQLTFSITKSTFLMSCVFVIKIIFLVISMFTSVIVDHCAKKKILVLSSFIQAFDLILLFLLYINDFLTIHLLFIFIIIQTFFSTFSISARNAIIPLIVERKDLVKASSSLSIIMQTLQISSYLFAGILISRFDVNGAIIIDSISFILAAFLLVKIKIKEEQNLKINLDFKLYEELLNGINFIKDEKVILAVMFVTFGGNLFSAPTESLMPAYFNESEFSIDAFSHYMLIVAIGSIIGSYILSKIKINIDIMKLGKLLSMGFFIGGIGISLLYINIGLWPYVCALAIGISEGFVSVLNASIIQIRTPQQMMARTFSVFKCTSYIASPLGVVLAGVLGEYMNLNIIFLPFGIGLSLVAIYTLIFFKNTKIFLDMKKEVNLSSIEY